MTSQIDQHYMVISSDEYDEIYSSNSNVNFTIDLPSALNLGMNWEVALTEIWFRSSESKEQINICADFCMESLVNGKFINLLRRVQVKKGINHIIYTNPNYFLVNRSTLKTILLYIRSDTNENISFIRGQVTVQLHFRKRVHQIF